MYDFNEIIDKKQHRYAEILFEIANGINPATGEEIEEWLFDQPEIIRALYAGYMALCKTCNTSSKISEASCSRNSENKPGNAGKKWTTEDDEQVMDAFNTGVPIKQMSLDFKRSEHAIALRIEKLLGITAEERIKHILEYRKSSD